MALRFELCETYGFTPNNGLASRLMEEGFKGGLKIGGETYGLVIDVGGYYKNFIVLAPALTMSMEEIDLALALLDRLFHRLTAT